MALKEAIEDGITVTRNSRGRKIYSIPCEICRKKIESVQYSRNHTYICGYCKNVIKEKEKALMPDVETKYDRRFSSAIENIEKQVKDVKKYDKAIKAAETRMYRYDSIPEAMVAIELLKNKIKIIPQQKIGRYKADFALPEPKVILEVDGELYHTSLEKEGMRDMAIIGMMGKDWKVVHIPSQYVLKDITKVVPYIKAYLEKYTDVKKR